MIPEKDSAIKEAQTLVTPNIVDFLPLLPDFSVAKIDPPPEFVGKNFKELELRSRYHVYVIAIRNKHTGFSLLQITSSKKTKNSIFSGEKKISRPFLVREPK